MKNLMLTNIMKWVSTMAKQKYLKSENNPAFVYTSQNRIPRIAVSYELSS